MWKNLLRRILSLDTLESKMDQLIASQGLIKEQIVEKNTPESPAKPKQSVKLENPIAQNMELIKQFDILNSDKKSILSFELVDIKTLDDTWKTFGTDYKNQHLLKGMMSSIAGGAANVGLQVYSTKGLFKSTVDPEKLIRYKDKTYGSIVHGANGKIESHTGFEMINGEVFTPMLVFQIMSIATQHHYMEGLQLQLKDLKERIDKLLDFQIHEREAKLIIASLQVADMSNRSYFTVEDFVSLNNLKYQLSVIRFEYLLKMQKEIFKILHQGQIISQAEYDIVVNDKDINFLEKAKLGTGKFANMIGKGLKEISSAVSNSTIVKGAKDVFSNSKSEFDDFVKQIHEGDYFYFSKVALEAENLYQSLRLIELKMNICDRNPDENRLGKISEMVQSFKNPTNIDSIHPQFEELNSNLRSAVENLFKISLENSITNRNEITKINNKVDCEFSNLQKIFSGKDKVKNEKDKVLKLFSEEKSYIIDSRSDEIQLYIQ